MITFKIQENVSPENRGWVDDRVVAYSDGMEVGYIKTSYIPLANFQKFYPTIFNWMDQIAGHCIFDSDKEHYHWRELNNIGKRQLIKNLWSRANHEMGCLQTLSEQAPDYELNGIISELESYFDKQYSGDFSQFKSYHIDRPHVAFIKVDEGYRLKGVAKKLYYEASKYLDQKQLLLHASTLQTDGPKVFWDKARKHGLTGFCGHSERLFLLPEKIRAKKL